MKLTLCGSTKFKDAFIDWNLRLSKRGHVVYSVAGFGHSGDVLTEREKEILDKVHFAKIDNSEGIVVLNVDGYFGSSTASEIVYAYDKGKYIWCLRKGTTYADTSIAATDILIKHAREICPHKGCFNPLGQPPCVLCYG